jgi:FkbM family methyltransferase
MPRVDGLKVLGYAARATRRSGLGSVLDAGRDAVDGVCARRGWFPLSFADGEVQLRGLLRHRSFLDELGSGRYEPYSKELFCAALAPGSTVIDGGSHIGYYAQLALAHERRIAKLLALEPDPANFVALQKNLATCDATRVELRRSALADRTGLASFHVSSGTISSSLFRRPAVRTRWRAVEVPVTTIDDAVKTVPHPGVLVAKLDLEGAEVLALNGMKRTVVSAAAATLLVEMNPEALADAGHRPTDLLDALRGLGLSVALIDERSRSLQSVAELNSPTKGNLYCVKPSPSMPAAR